LWVNIRQNELQGGRSIKGSLNKDVSVLRNKLDLTTITKFKAILIVRFVLEKLTSNLLQTLSRLVQGATEICDPLATPKLL
jgi:hypothetical protein